MPPGKGFKWSSESFAAPLAAASSAVGLDSSTKPAKPKQDASWDGILVSPTKPSVSSKTVKKPFSNPSNATARPQKVAQGQEAAAGRGSIDRQQQEHARALKNQIARYSAGINASEDVVGGSVNSLLQSFSGLWRVLRTTQGRVAAGAATFFMLLLIAETEGGYLSQTAGLPGASRRMRSGAATTSSSSSSSSSSVYPTSLTDLHATSDDGCPPGAICMRHAASQAQEGSLLHAPPAPPAPTRLSTPAVEQPPADAVLSPTQGAAANQPWDANVQPVAKEELFESKPPAKASGIADFAKLFMGSKKSKGKDKDKDRDKEKDKEKDKDKDKDKEKDKDRDKEKGKFSRPEKTKANGDGDFGGGGRYSKEHSKESREEAREEEARKEPGGSRGGAGASSGREKDRGRDRERERDNNTRSSRASSSSGMRDRGGAHGGRASAASASSPAMGDRDRSRDRDRDRDREYREPTTSTSRREKEREGSADWPVRV